MTLAWPWLFLLLPLPWAVRRWMPIAPQKTDDALFLPFYHQAFADGGGASTTRWRWRWLSMFLWLIWILVLCAGVRPQWLGEPIPIMQEGRDLMLMVDLSGSMQIEDMQIKGRPVQRIDAVKQVSSDFIDRRSGDRIGLILFGTQAYLQSPLTFDRDTVKQFLNESFLGLAGERTAIGDALGLGVKRLRDRERKDRVMILLTDGVNTAGITQPLEAAKVAADSGLRIHTIGFGADEMVIRDFWRGSRKVNPSEDIDEATLQQVADMTGGQYFRARSVGDLEKVYAELDRIEPTAAEGGFLRPVTELFYWPLGLALMISVLYAGLRLLASSRWAATLNKGGL